MTAIKVIEQTSIKQRTRRVTKDSGSAFTFAGACHQFLNCFFRRFSFVKDGMHLFGDWHLDAARMGETDGGCGGEDSFRDHAMHSLNDLSQLFAAAEFDADAAVS